MSQDVLSVIASFFGSLGFAIIYNIRGRRAWIPAIGGAVFWAVYLVFLHFVNNEYLGFFVVAILITIYSEIWARILKTPATTVLMPTVIPLIPGGSLYYAMDAALRRDMPQFIVKGQAAIGLAIALAAGIMVVTSLRRPIEALVHIVAKKKHWRTNVCKYIMNLWESRIHKRRPALHKRRGFPLRTKERRAMPMYVTYSDLIQIGIFIVALVGLRYTIFGKRKYSRHYPNSDGCYTITDYL